MFQKRHIELATQLLESIKAKDAEQSLANSKTLFEEIFHRNFVRDIEKTGTLRYNSLRGPEENIQYLGVLYENAPQSGVYENFSLVVFPDNTNSSSQLLLCYGIGTGGITDDAEWLGIPWIKRSIKLLLRLIEKQEWNVAGTQVFVKDDITDEQIDIPSTIRNSLGNFSDYQRLWSRYGKYLPSVCVVEPNEKGAQAFLSHLSLYAKFRDWPVKREFQTIWEQGLLPKLIELWRSYPSVEQLLDYLPQRKYLILQGPPGTGKTFLAKKIAEHLKRNSKIADYQIIQFHATVSYEDFVEGIRPDTKSNQLIFRESKGPLLESIDKAQEAYKNNNNIGYLLIIDEINRGDIAKILGESIFLFEPGEERKIKLRSGKEITMPKNLYVIGTMNTADRTIAILDFAIRRRFAFIDVWPSCKELEEILKDCHSQVKDKALELYNKLQEIFFYYAPDEELHLQPGHTYFIANSENELMNRLKYEIAPLLQEYLNEGRLTLAKNEILAFIENNLGKLN